MATMAGLLIVDKPEGVTSHDVVNRIRRLAGTRRVGHAGTLDPLATGVLLVCVGRATRLVEYLVGQPKQYVTAVRLGQTTNTYDAEGEVVAERPFAHLTPAVIDEALAQFRGPIQQKAPIYSAIKKNGQPLYKLARQGKAVELPVRQVTLYELSLLAATLPEIELQLTCSSGTYVRSLAHDLGEALGCGGHVSRLRRTAVGDFSLEQATALEALTAENIGAFLQPLTLAVAHLPRLDLAEEEVAALANGRFVVRQPHQSDAEWVQVYGEDGRFVGIARGHEALWQPHKIFHAIGE